MVCTCEILARMSFGQVKSVFCSTDTHTHTQDRLDKPRSTLAEALLKTYRIPLVATTSVVGLNVDKHPYT